MSNFLAIATVTATLRALLNTAVSTDVSGATATNLRPVESETGLPNPGVNIYLFQVTPNTALHNSDLPTRTRDGSFLQRPRLALDLHYLLTFYGSEGQFEPQRVLGSVTRTLHAQPLLTPEQIQSTIPGFVVLTDSDLASELERVKFSPVSMSLEELSKLWSVFLQTPYTLSMVYLAGVVLIEGTETPSSVLPVQQRNVSVMPSLEVAAPITPADVPGLQLWLQSDTGVTYDIDGVSQWSDQSGGDNHAVQNNTSFRPSFVAHGLGRMPVLRFDGIDDYLAIQNLSYSAGGAISALTVCALVRSDSSNRQIIASFDDNEYWQLALNDQVAANQNVGWSTRGFPSGTNALRSTTSYTDGNWHLITAWFSDSATTDKQLFVDGEQVATATAHGGNALGSGTTRFGFIGVGSEANVFDGTRLPALFLQGDLAELLIYHHALSDDERRQLERYFVQRYRS